MLEIKKKFFFSFLFVCLFIFIKKNLCWPIPFFLLEKLHVNLKKNFGMEWAWVYAGFLRG